MKRWLWWSKVHPWKVFVFALWTMGCATALDFTELSWLPTLIAAWGVSLGTLLLIKERDMS